MKLSLWAFLGAMLSTSAVAAPVIVNSDGVTAPYTVLSNAGFGFEVSDCSPGANSSGVVTPPSAIPHIRNQFDTTLNKNVFAVYLFLQKKVDGTIAYDDDRCFQNNRQRTEFKAGYQNLGNNDYLKGQYGNTMTWRWRFKLDAGFQVSSSWSIIHSRKANADFAGDPMMQISAVNQGSGDVFWFQDHSYNILSTTPVQPFRGVWVEAYEKATFPTGAYSITFKRVSDGALLWTYTNPNFNQWFDPTNLTDWDYAKWGLYRGLTAEANSNALRTLRDEVVLYSDICVAKAPDVCTSLIGVPPPPPPPPPPGAPTVTFSAAPTSIFVGQASVLTWTSTNATSCAGSGFTASATSGSASISPPATVTDSITCTGAGGSTTKSVTVTVTPPPDTTPPTVPAGLTGTPVSTTQINLAWNASTDNVGVTGYKVSRNGVQISSQVVTSLSDTGLTPATTYNYAVLAFDAAGNNSAQATVSATTASVPPPPPPPPPPPTATLSVSPTVITLGQTATLTWSSTNATYCTGGTGFTTSETSGTLVITPLVTSSYQTNCTGPSGSASSAVVTVTVNPAVDTTPPSVPGNLSAIVTSPTQVNLAWTAATDNVSVAGYTILRNGVKILTTTATTFFDAGLTPSTTYTYSVVAFDSSGNVSAPVVITATTAAVQPPPVGHHPNKGREINIPKKRKHHNG